MNDSTQPRMALTNIRIVVAVVSLLFSILAFYTDNLVNSDGVLYLNMAKAFLDGGLTATAQLYDWPFFSILVAQVHSLSGLGLEASAEVINSILFVIFTDALLLICSQLLATRTQLIIATLFILSFVTLNDYRSYIIRDVGYWAFMSLAIYRMLLFLREPSFHNASTWQAASLFALLFRIEALVIILASPVFIFIKRDFKTATKLSLKLVSGLILLFLIFSSLLLNQHGVSESFGKLHQVVEFLNLSQLQASFDQKSTIIAQRVLNGYSAEYSSMILMSGLISMFMAKLITGLGLVNIGVYSYARYQQKTKLKNSLARHYLLFFAVINTIILLAFLYKHYFISTRYMMMLIVSLFLLMLPLISQWLENVWQLKHKVILIIVSFLLLIGVVDSFHSSVSKGYVKQTAYWASKNLPANSRVLTDDIFIDFYFRLSQNHATIQLDKKLKNYKSFDYLIRIEKSKHKKNQEAITGIALEIIHKDQNSRGDTAVVYKVLHDRKQNQ